MAALSLQTITPSGIAPTYAAAGGSGDTCAVPSNSEDVFVHAKNTNAATATITINPVSPTAVKVAGVGNLAPAAITKVVPATTGDVMIGPIPAAYIDALGNLNLAYSGTTTNLTVAVLRLARVSS